MTTGQRGEAPSTGVQELMLKVTVLLPEMAWEVAPMEPPEEAPTHCR